MGKLRLVPKYQGLKFVAIDIPSQPKDDALKIQCGIYSIEITTGTDLRLLGKILDVIERRKCWN